jgi:3-methylcrotonyl-CoA carboxylase beta subunit
MPPYKSLINTGSEDFRKRYAHNKGLAAELRKKLQEARYTRPQRDLDRLKKAGKMTPRERIAKLLDPGTPFLEFSTLAAGEAYGGEAPGASCITGIGVVSGREVIIHADDSTVKAGAWYPLTAKKIMRCLDIAIENRLPVVHLSDSAGGQLQLQSELFPDKYLIGRIFRNQAIMSKLGIKQLALVFGHCTAGGAYIPALSDYSVIVKGTGGVFLGGPPLVKAATGQVMTADEIGGMDLHTRMSGTVDYPAATEDEAIVIGRDIVAQFERPKKTLIEQAPAEDPLYDPDELYGIIPDDIKNTFDMREVIARIVDGSRFHEYKPNYGPTIICGFAYIWGYKIGIIANNGILFNDSTKKATHFITLCNQNNTPILFMQNITGFMVGRDYEIDGITKDGAKMIMAQVNSHVPKFTLMCHASFGAGNYAMCGRAFDGRFLFTWPNHQIAIMGKEQAANTLVEVKLRQLERNGVKANPEVLEKVRADTLRAYETQMNAYYSTSEIWDDGVLDPVDTRNALGIALAASLNAPFGEPGYGIFRF